MIIRNALSIIDIIIKKYNEMTELFINFGGLDSFFPLFSTRDILMRKQIISFLIQLNQKYPITFIEKPIYIEKLMLLFGSVSTLQEVLNFK